MFGIGFADVFHAKIVNNQTEADRTICVREEARSGGSRYVAG